MNEGSKKFDLKEVADALSEIMEKVKITAFPKFSALDNDRLLVVYSISNRAYRGLRSGTPDERRAFQPRFALVK